jgi:putative flavoprotein involved in K+ transport
MIEHPPIQPLANGGASVEVAVIGAGQAGLAIGYFLARQGRTFVILDGADSVGAAWRKRWESLILFTSRRYNSLPGLAFPGDPDGYPTRDEVIAYLENYTATFALPVQLGSAVRSLTKKGETFVLSLDGRTIEANQVVVATGPFQTPRVPAFARELGPEVFQTHSADYRVPRDVPPGVVLVVGGGNTGFQIASELSRTHDVHLSIGTRQTPLPQRFLGRDLFWWLEATRVINTTVDSKLGQRLRTRDTLIGLSRRALRRDGVTIKPRAIEASGQTVNFADSTELSVDAVIWATGFGLDHSWINLPLPTEHGQPRHRRGVTEIPSLYFLGLPWQHTRGSALLGWVQDDAEYLAHHIAAQTGNAPPSTVRPSSAATGAAA